MTGTERYSVELLAALADLDPPAEFRVYFDTNTPPDSLHFPGYGVPLPGSRFWTLRHLSIEMLQNPPDLLFVPSHVIPPIHPRSVVTVHDLGYLVEPHLHEPVHRRQLEWTTRWNAHAASGIIAVSESTKQDLIERLQVDPARVAVVHHGISTRFVPASEADIHAIRRRYGLREPMILTVGTIQPRKNLLRLIQAFEQLAVRDHDLQLVFSGAPGWQADAILQRARQSPFHERILHLGYVPDRSLPALYSAASVFTFPSLYEGFGMPILEAMACGTPVVAARRSSIPEIAGNAAMMIDPLNTDELASAIDQILSSEQLRQQLRDRGFARTSTSGWMRSAIETFAFLRDVSENVPRYVKSAIARGNE